MLSELLIQKLTWNNLETLQTEINNISYYDNISSLSYLLWSFFGTDVYFCIIDKIIFLFGQYNNTWANISFKNEIVDHNNFFIIRPIFDQNTYQIDNVMNQAIEIFKKYLSNNNKPIVCENLNLDELNQFETINQWNSNYLYLTENLKFFSKKALQKKRNNLHKFINENQNIRIEKFINSKQQHEAVLNWLILNKDLLSSNENEINLLQQTLDHFNQQKMPGSILYLDNQIIGFTIGNLNNDTYEIFIEKCFKNKRGAYQYLLSQNLILNDINTKLIDRQDDLGIEAIRKSKMSYKPIKIIQKLTKKIK